MTILDRINKGEEKKVPATEAKEQQDSTESQVAMSNLESKFEKMMEEFRANAGFSVDTGEQPVSTMIELLSSKWVNLPIVVLLAYIRYCINHGLKKDITVKIGYNKPASVPMNFAVNEEMIEEHYPSDVVEIN